MEPGGCTQQCNTSTILLDICVCDVGYQQVRKQIPGWCRSLKYPAGAAGKKATTIQANHRINPRICKGVSAEKLTMMKVKVEILLQGYEDANTHKRVVVAAESYLTRKR